LPPAIEYVQVFLSPLGIRDLPLFVAEKLMLSLDHSGKMEKKLLVYRGKLGRILFQQILSFLYTL
jgi:hypothetical protein